MVQRNMKEYLVDTGASTFSKVGKDQFIALQQILPSLSIDDAAVGEASIRFGPGETTKSIDSTLVQKPIEKINFHTVNTRTPFICCL